MNVVFVDLDRTLINCDSSLVEFRAMTNQLGAIGTLQVFLRRRSFTKSKIKHILSNYSYLVDYELYFSAAVAQLLMKYHERGFKIVLATGAIKKTALSATEKYSIPIYDHICSTSSHRNKGRNKLGLMDDWTKKNHAKGFDYIGDAFIDLQIMKMASHSFFVGKPMVFFIGKIIFKISNFTLMREK